MSDSISQSSSNGGVNIAAGRDVDIEVTGDFVGGNKTVNTKKYIENQTIVQLTDIEQLPPEKGKPPYKGLDYFTEADAHRFYGRDAATAVLVKRLKERHIFAVIGASGSGKSSLVRAGLIPVIKGDKQLPDGTQPPAGSWQVHKLTPTEQPLQNLAATLFPHDTTQQKELIAQATQTADALQNVIPTLPKLAQNDPIAEKLAEMAALVTDPNVLAALKADLEANAPQHVQNHLLLIDQFEEIFTLCKSEPERVAFIENLLQAAQAEFKIVLTMRADFYAHCLKYESLRQLLKEAQEPIGAMTPDELAEAILEPAKQNNWQLQQGLVELMLDDVGQEPGALPLLSHALLETWKNRRSRTMTLSGYKKAGGVKGAIAKTAEQVYTHLTPDQQAIARRIFIALTELGENGTQDTRRRAELNEIGTDEATHTVLHQLADARLITLHTDTVDVAHEALIRGWPRLQAWLAEDREQVRFERQLQRDAEEWDARGRETGSLYRGSRLSQIREQQETLTAKGGLSKEFVQASLDHHEDELQKAQQLAEERRQRIKEVEEERTAAQAQMLLSLPSVITADKNLTRTDARRAVLMAVQAINMSKAQKNAKLSKPFARMQITALFREVQNIPFIFQGHTDHVWTVAFSPDGKMLASASDDQTVRLWHIADHQAKPTILQGHTDHVRSVAFSPDGKMLASASDDQTVRLWHLTDHQAKPTILRGHEGVVLSVAFSPNGQTLASASDDQTVRLWDLSNPQGKPTTLRGHTGWVWSVAFSPNGQTLASSSNDQTVRLWDLGDRQDKSTILQGHISDVDSVAFSPDGQTLASASSGQLQLWHLDNLKAEPTILQGHTGRVWSVAFSPDGQTLASSSNDRTLRLWNLTNPQAKPTILQSHTERVLSVAFSPDGKLLASSGEDNTVRLWNLADLQAKPTILQSYNLLLNSVAFVPDDQTLAFYNISGDLHLWDLAHPQAKPIILGKNFLVSSVVFSPDGQTLAYFNRRSTIVRLWNLADPQDEFSILSGHRGQVLSIAFSPDGQTLASSSDDQTMRLWNLTDPKAKSIVIQGHTDVVRSVVFSPDGLTLASSGKDQTVRLWNLVNPEAKPTTLQGHTGIVRSMAFSPDGQTIASASDDQTIRLWDMANPQAKPTILQDHTGAVLSVAFSPDGQTIASASDDQTIRLWDMANPQAKPTILQGHADAVWSVAFSPNGRRVVSASNDKTIRLWATLDGLVTIAQEWARRNFTWEEWQQYLGSRPYERTCPQYPPHPSVPESEWPEEYRQQLAVERSEQ